VNHRNDPDEVIAANTDRGGAQSPLPSPGHKRYIARLRTTPATDVRFRLKPGLAKRKGFLKHITNLKGLTGAEFDNAYIDHEVTYHQAVIDAPDKTLIPSAQNAELKTLLVKVRPAFVAHLGHAEMIQSSLGK